MLKLYTQLCIEGSHVKCGRNIDTNIGAKLYAVFQWYIFVPTYALQSGHFREPLCKK